jgi:hypothetical protein
VIQLTFPTAMSVVDFSSRIPKRRRDQSGGRNNVLAGTLARGVTQDFILINERIKHPGTHDRDLPGRYRIRIFRFCFFQPVSGVILLHFLEPLLAIPLMMCCSIASQITSLTAIRQFVQ